MNLIPDTDPVLSQPLPLGFLYISVRIKGNTDMGQELYGAPVETLTLDLNASEWADKLGWTHIPNNRKKMRKIRRDILASLDEITPKSAGHRIHAMTTDNGIKYGFFVEFYENTAPFWRMGATTYESIWPGQSYVILLGGQNFIVTKRGDATFDEVIGLCHPTEGVYLYQDSKDENYIWLEARPGDNHVVWNLNY